LISYKENTLGDKAKFGKDQRGGELREGKIDGEEL
jgi:hypothetical protein